MIIHETFKEKVHSGKVPNALYDDVKHKCIEIVMEIGFNVM